MALDECHHADPVILGSRSPRRRELLAALLGPGRLRIVPPRSAEEPGFAGLSTDEAIETRLIKTVMMKQQDVADQVAAESIIVVADTIVIASRDNGERIVLGQPDPDQWREEVRGWFSALLSGTAHSVWTGFCVSRADQYQIHIVRSTVSFYPLSEELIDWYISTEESPGKAGGYGIQGHGAALVCGLQGSLTSVIGLPLIEVRDALQSLGVTCGNPASGGHSP